LKIFNFLPQKILSCYRINYGILFKDLHKTLEVVFYALQRMLADVKYASAIMAGIMPIKETSASGIKRKKKEKKAQLYK